MVLISKLIWLLDIYNQEGYNGMILRSQVHLCTSCYLWSKKTIKKRFKSPHFMVLSEIDDIPNDLFLDFLPVILRVGRLDSIKKNPCVFKNPYFWNYLVVDRSDILAWLLCSCSAIGGWLGDDWINVWDHQNKFELFFSDVYVYKYHKGVHFAPIQTRHLARVSRTGWTGFGKYHELGWLETAGWLETFLEHLERIAKWSRRLHL